jgi:hypothetical protein
MLTCRIIIAKKGNDQVPSASVRYIIGCVYTVSKNDDFCPTTAMLKKENVKVIFRRF